MKKRGKKISTPSKRGGDPLLSKFVRSSVTSIDDIKFSVCKDKQADPAVSPAGAQHLPSPPPPQATNYRATLAERFNTRFGGGGGEGGGVPNVTTRLNPAISPTDRGPANFMVTNGDE